MKIEDWKNLTFYQLENKYNMSRETLYKEILNNKLYLHKSLVERGKMTDLEEKYVVATQELSVTQLANMFHKSYNAMLIYLKTKGYFKK